MPLSAQQHYAWWNKNINSPNQPRIQDAQQKVSQLPTVVGETKWTPHSFCHCTQKSEEALPSPPMDASCSPRYCLWLRVDRVIHTNGCVGKIISLQALITWNLSKPEHYIRRNGTRNFKDDSAWFILMWFYGLCKVNVAKDSYPWIKENSQNHSVGLLSQSNFLSICRVALKCKSEHAAYLLKNLCWPPSFSKIRFEVLHKLFFLLSTKASTHIFLFAISLSGIASDWTVLCNENSSSDPCLLSSYPSESRSCMSSSSLNISQTKITTYSAMLSLKFIVGYFNFCSQVSFFLFILSFTSLFPQLLYK